ncbi:MAG: hypothetical protein EA393_08225 [Bacteroidetes bacterium]|nr:MAG: hypothetical protein EA393_08225 [Bacteroidota bacterium]
MSFLYPWFLLALSAISIPIIIHLFHFRRFRKIYFSNIRFLEQITDETQKQARLKHLLVLISRILAIIFLVMAFARPYIPADEGLVMAENNYVSVFIDNSFSMEASSSYGTLLDHAKVTAGEIAQTFEPSDGFQLLTNDLEGRHQRFVSREEFLSMVSQVDFSPNVRMLSQIFDRQKTLMHEEGIISNAWSFVLSDFQINISDWENFDPDTLINQVLIPFQTQRPSNLFIDSVWIDNPVRMRGQVLTVNVRIYNDSSEPLQNQPVRLYVNEVQRSVATFDIRAGSYVDVSLTYTLDNTSNQAGYIEISDYPVTFDDRFYFAFQLSDQIPVLVINQDQPNPFLNALFSTDTSFIFRNTNVTAIDFSVFPAQNLIILNELRSIGEGLALELRRYVEAGGNLLIFPSPNADLTSYNALLSAMNVNGFLETDTVSTRVTGLNELHPIYSGVFERIPENIDLPRVEQYFVITRHTEARDNYLMQLQNGNYFFVSVPSGQGQVFLSSVPANDQFSNFPRHAMFVPTLYNIGLHSASFHPLFYTIGKDQAINVRGNAMPSEGLYRIQGRNMEIIPEIRNIGTITNLIVHDQIGEAGNYRLKTDDENLRVLSFNYDRRESLLDSYNASDINSLNYVRENDNVSVLEPGIISFDKQMEAFMGGRQLWKIFVLLGILFLLTEVLLLRFMKG